jgi:hypothetical protein
MSTMKTNVTLKQKFSHIQNKVITLANYNKHK